MTFAADENFPRLALAALRNAGWEVFSVAEECPGISVEQVADAAVALLQSQPDLRGIFCVITRERIRVRPMRTAP
jgi:hypothetical protein